MNKRKLKSKILLFIMLAIVSLVYILPIALMVLGSFKTQSEAVRFTLTLPENWMFSNYKHVVETGKIFEGYFNSFVITASVVVLSLVFGSFAGIYVSRRNDRSGRAMYYYFIFGFTMTVQTVSTFALLQFLNIYGSYLGVILIFTAIRMPFTVMTFASFVKGVPKEIDEAAVIDGCGPIRMIFSVLMPILKPIMITNLIITAISVWNNFMIPLYFFSGAGKLTIPQTVYSFYGLYARDWQYVFAALVLTVIPVTLLYLGLQKQIVAGMTSGAVKG